MSIRTTSSLAIDPLQGMPHFADLMGRDGQPCRVWKNPTKASFGRAIAQGQNASGLRGLVTADALYVWQSNSLLHADVERELRIEGVRIALRQQLVQLNDETAALPEHFPFVFVDRGYAAEQDVEGRRKVVEYWLRGNPHIRSLYPDGFQTAWYSWCGSQTNPSLGHELGEIMHRPMADGVFHRLTQSA